MSVQHRAFRGATAVAVSASAAATAAAAAATTTTRRKRGVFHNAVLACPSKVAQALDWNNTTVRGQRAAAAAMTKVLTVSITLDRMELAVASHPSYHEPIEALAPIPLLLRRYNNQDYYDAPAEKSNSNNNRQQQHHQQREEEQQQRKRHTPLCRTTTSSSLVTHCNAAAARAQLAAILAEHAICGVLVAWPVQRDSGRCGKPCGRTLYWLDQLLLLWHNNNSNDNNNNHKPTANTAANDAAATCKPLQLPVGLYDASRTVPDEDEWGRAEAHGRPPLFVQVEDECVELGASHAAILAAAAGGGGETTRTTTFPRLLNDRPPLDDHVAAASHEQYHYYHHHHHPKEEQNLMDCATVWTDFCQRHWPELTVAVVAPPTNDFDDDDDTEKKATAITACAVGAGPLLRTPTTGTCIPSDQTKKKKKNTTCPLSGTKTVDLFAWINGRNRAATQTTSYRPRALTL